MWIRHGRFFFLEVERGFHSLVCRSGDGTGFLKPYDFDDACKTTLHWDVNFSCTEGSRLSVLLTVEEEVSQYEMLHRGDIVGSRCMRSRIGILHDAPFADFAAHGLYMLQCWLMGMLNMLNRVLK